MTAALLRRRRALLVVVLVLAMYSTVLPWWRRPVLDTGAYRTGNTPIDVVVTWVDGRDRVWQAGFRSAYTASRGNVDTDRAPLSGPFVHDELYYNIRGLIANMPWIRTVWLATQAPHQPPYLDELRLRAPFEIKVVHHDRFIPARYLPTYNSDCIDAYLDQIPNITDRFIYLNDDIIVTRPLKPTQFFTGDGRAIVPVQYLDESWFVCTFMHREHSCARQNARRILNRSTMYSRLHGAHASHRAMFERARLRFGVSLLDALFLPRVRSPQSVPWMWTLPNVAAHAEMVLVYTPPYTFAFYHALLHVQWVSWQASHMRRADIVCINLLSPRTELSVSTALYTQLRNWIIPVEEHAAFVL
jgi:hypothetical protein